LSSAAIGASYSGLKMGQLSTSISWTTTKGRRFMPMKNPPHPGSHVRLDCLEPLGLSVTEGAKVLGVTRQALNNLVNCKGGISPEMAIRLSKAFGGSPGVWLRLQMNYDLAQIERKAAKIVVKRMYPKVA
jgi:addiction module HigA family antidote